MLFLGQGENFSGFAGCVRVSFRVPCVAVAGSALSSVSVQMCSSFGFLGGRFGGRGILFFSA